MPTFSAAVRRVCRKHAPRRAHSAPDEQAVQPGVRVGARALGAQKVGTGKGKAAHMLAAERHAVAEHRRRRRAAGRMIVSSARARTPPRVRYV